MAAVKITIELTVHVEDLSDNSAEDIVDRLLDDGVLQDAFNEAAEDRGTGERVVQAFCWEGESDG